MPNNLPTKINYNATDAVELGLMSPGALQKAPNQHMGLLCGEQWKGSSGSFPMLLLAPHLLAEASLCPLASLGRSDATTEIGAVHQKSLCCSRRVRC